MSLPNSLKRSLLMTKSVSTFSRILFKPSSACCLRFLPSKLNGIVTIPTVKIPKSLAT